MFSTVLDSLTVLFLFSLSLFWAEHTHFFLEATPILRLMLELASKFRFSRLKGHNTQLSCAKKINKINLA